MSVEQVEFEQVNKHECPECGELLTIVPAQQKVLPTAQRTYLREQTYRCSLCGHLQRWLAKDDETTLPSLSLLHQRSNELQQSVRRLGRAHAWTKFGLLVAILMLGFLVYENDGFQRLIDQRVLEEGQPNPIVIERAQEQG